MSCTRSVLNSYQSLFSSLKDPFPENSSEDYTLTSQFDLELQKLQVGMDSVCFLLTIVSPVPIYVLAESMYVINVLNE